MHAWKRIHIPFTLECVVEGGNANNLTTIIIQALMRQGGLIQEESMKRLISQGCHTARTFQLKNKFVPYMMGQHCMAHRTNLVIQVLSNLPMVARLEVCYTHCILISPTPQSDIWNSLSLLRSCKQEG
jgi:hypothetical protein